MQAFAEGARGFLISKLRLKLQLTNSGDPVDHLFEPEMTERVKEKQRGHLPETGVVDPATWALLMDGAAFPSLFERALMVVGAIENHGFAKTFLTDGGDADPAGLTGGIIGFTVHFGSLLRVLEKIPEPVRTAAFASAAIPTTAQAKFRELLDLANDIAAGAVKRRRDKAKELFPTTHPRRHLEGPWLKFMQTVLASPDGVAAQVTVAKEEYFDRAGDIAAALNLTSEYAFVLAFSLAVQSRPAGASPGTGSERERRIAIASKAAEDIGRDLVRSYELRQIGLATGRAYPNQKFIDLARWGLETTSDPPPPAKSRILTIALSEASAAALPQFEEAAVAQQVVEERVLETAAVQKRIKAAGIRSRDWSRLWRTDLRKRANRAPRARRIELFTELNELPVSCLILGSAKAGKVLMWSPGTPTPIAAIDNDDKGPEKHALTWYRLPDLWYPLAPRMPSALVILYAPAAVDRKESLAQAVAEAIGSVNEGRPLILGWTGRVAFPPKGSTTLANTFFGTVKAGMPSMTLDNLVRTAPEKIIQAWGKACHAAFAADKTFSRLWREPKKGVPACAALAPDGTMWRAMAQPADPLFMERVP